METYLTPADVDALTAARVLGFLNIAADAEEIATAVEIPNERDVGLRVGQRIIDRRAELGTFTSLQQILDVPYIGPERFTEIVTTIAARLSRPSSGTTAIGDDIGELRAQVAALRSQVDALAMTISLTADRTAPLLGLPVQITARVLGGVDNRPRPGVPVTFIAPSAIIEHADGMIHRTGISATVLTGPLGTARVTVYASTDEPMLPAQKSALLGLLAGFPDVDVPSKAAATLDQLIADYSWDVNYDFRAAVDLLYKRYGQSLVDGVNTFDYLSHWPRVDAPVTAAAGGIPEETAGTQVRGNAVYTIGFRNWLGPWLQRFHMRTTRDATLDQNIRAVAASENAAGLIMAQTADLIRSRRGIVGAWMGRTEARRTLNAFLSDGMPGVVEQQRTGLIAVLQGAEATLRSGGGADAFVSVAGVQKQLTEQVRTAPISDTLDARLHSIETTLDSKIDQSDFNAALSKKVNVQAFSDYQESVEERFSGYVPIATYTEFQNSIEEQLKRKADTANVANLQESLDAKADTSALMDFQQNVNDTLARKVDQTDFREYQATVETRIEERPTLETLNTRDAELKRRLDQLERTRGQQ